VLDSSQVIVFVTTARIAVPTFVRCTMNVSATSSSAVAFNPQAAALMGVNISYIISFTFGLGSALAGAGGILYAMNYASIEPLMGVTVGLKAFVAAVFGGIGHLPGAALGGLALGLIETFAGGIPGVSTYRDGIAFAILILVLLFKPAGLLGKATVEKV
jgi:branched-chain amino acid transport system permease protein